ncbi:Alpha/beta hydrolase fold-1 [Dillenia turbinata]|uniref:Alpha/beta hydrolase fold-1 n=1 Tax=Dillenia turbinata TaxID=194707 RepID=A0AAN8UHA8_9MAGN
MANITEEQQKDDPPPISKPNTLNVTKNPISTSHSPNPFAFWAYFTLSVSLITFLFVSLSSLITPQEPKSWFLSLPSNLRLHYSKGRIIKVQTNPNSSPIEVFTIEDGPRNSEHVFLVHGLGCSSFSFNKVVGSLGSSGIHAVAVDLPGSGFSDKSTLVEEDHWWGGVFGRFKDVYDDINEKGLFWGFDQLIENGYMPYEDNKIRVSRPRKVVRPLSLGPEEMGWVLGQVIDSMKLGQVHLVLHDSALGMSAYWVAENSEKVRSVTVLDSALREPAFPLWILEVPVIREFVLGLSFVYNRVVNICCAKSLSNSVAEAYRVLLSGRNGRESIVGTGKKLNFSFDVAEWAGSQGLNDVPIQVLWSSGWSKEWTEEGHRVAKAIPRAKFVGHAGGRWPQEDSSDELAEKIAQFVSSLPRTIHEVKEEPLPEHIQRMFDEANAGDHHHHHHHHHHHQDHGEHNHYDGHGHVSGSGYMDAYGLGGGWGH